MSGAGRGRLAIRRVPGPPSPKDRPGRSSLNKARRNRTLALAGVFQAACLVQQLAHHGRADEAALAASINSVLALDAPSAEAVYGNARGVMLGLQCLRDNLNQPKSAGGVEIARYVASVLQLERTLERDTVMLAAIRHGLKSMITALPVNHGSTNTSIGPNVTTQLAELYRATLSTIKPRIMVSGEHGHLNDPATAEMVRAVLLAGIRSAYLWRQLGGSRWQLFISGQTTVREAQQILEQLAARPTVTHARDR
jgi:high frequency lysogenization protein